MRRKAIVAFLIVCWFLAGLGQLRKNEVGADSLPPAQKLIASVSFDAWDVLSVASPKLEMPSLTVPNHLGGGFYPSSTPDLQSQPARLLETAFKRSKLHKRICVFLI